MLKGASIANDGYVDPDQIGRNDDALICRTNKTNCCRDMRGGEWYFPNRTQIDIQGNNEKAKRTDFFYRNRESRVVRLNTINNPPERGQFYCVVPDANDRNQTVYVNIGMSKSLLLI